MVNDEKQVMLYIHKLINIETQKTWYILNLIYLIYTHTKKTTSQNTVKVRVRVDFWPTSILRRRKCYKSCWSLPHYNNKRGIMSTPLTPCPTNSGNVSRVSLIVQS